MYAITGSVYVLQFLSGTNRSVTDATGAVWQTANIYETAAIVSLFTMIFIAALAAIKLMQQPLAGDAATSSATEPLVAEKVD